MEAKGKCAINRCRINRGKKERVNFPAAGLWERGIEGVSALETETVTGM